MLEIEVWKAWWVARAISLPLRRDERGDVTQTVILVAAFAAATIAISALIITKFMSKAESIPTG